MSRILFLAFGFSLIATCYAETPGVKSANRKPTALSKRPQIKISNLVGQLAAAGKLDILDKMIKSQVSVLAPDPAMTRVLLAKWDEIRKNKDYTQLDHFPALPLKQVETLRPLLGDRGGQSEKVEVAVLKATLEEVLDECGELAPWPSAVIQKIPMLTNGHFPDSSMSPCEQDRSIKVARVLNSLMATNGSEITIGKTRVRSAQKFFETLLASGYRVEMRNDRTFANFLSINWGDQPVIWPVWLDTGLKTKEGLEISVPMGHSHHSFVIEGPLFKADVMFYLGVDGVGFFGQVDERPAWTGTRTAYKLSSPEDSNLILKAVDYAGRYYRRIQSEASHLSVKMPMRGYGYLGVCNDSNALLEKIDHNSVSAFPLMRAAELDLRPAVNDGLDELMRALPKDSKDFPRTPANLARVLAMAPFDDLDDRDLHDEELRKIFKSLEAEVGHP